MLSRTEKDSKWNGELCEIHYSINILVNTLDLIVGLNLVLNFT